MDISFYILGLEIGGSYTTRPLKPNVLTGERSMVSLQNKAASFAKSRKRDFSVVMNEDGSCTITRNPDPVANLELGAKRRTGPSLVTVLGTMELGATLTVEGAEGSIRGTASRLQNADGKVFICHRIPGRLDAMIVTRLQPGGIEEDFSKVESPLPRMDVGETRTFPAPCDLPALRSQAGYWGRRLSAKFSVSDKGDGSATVTRVSGGDPMFTFVPTARLAKYKFEDIGPGEVMTIASADVVTKRILMNAVRDRSPYRFDSGNHPNGDFWIKRDK